jgi:hypothetical protein
MSEKTAIQDGMLAYFITQLRFSDSYIEEKMRKEPFFLAFKPDSVVQSNKTTPIEKKK